MKVKDLIVRLQACDPNAVVRALDSCDEEGFSEYAPVAGLMEIDMTKSLGYVVVDLE